MPGARAGQRGMGFASFLALAVLAAFLGTILFKLLPAYAGYWTLTSIMDDLAETQGPIAGGKKGIMDQLVRRIEVNDLRTVGAGAFTIEAAGQGEYSVIADYEQRIHLFFNVDAVLTFQHEVAVEGQ
jgi:hypothetical protein